MSTRPAWPVPPRVLVVDDKPTPRMAITDGLNLMGYQAEGADSGAEALASMASAAYDLMLLDLRMPAMDGVEVMQRARSFQADSQVIVLTAYGSLNSAIAAVRAGAADYLLKPCTIRDTEAAIAAALHPRRGVSFNQLAYSPRSGPAAALGEQEEEAEPTPMTPAWSAPSVAKATYFRLPEIPWDTKQGRPGNPGPSEAESQANRNVVVHLSWYNRCYSGWNRPTCIRVGAVSWRTAVSKAA